jgi:transposase InsO family protein
VKAMCEVFDISRAAYYAWLKRSTQKDKDLYRMRLIQEGWIASRKRYGYRRIVLWLQREKGLIFNHKAVLRLMNKMHIHSTARKAKVYVKSDAKKNLHRYENILKSDFTASGPNQKWVTDITYIQYLGGRAYLSVIKDLYDQFIVAYQLGKRMTTGLVTDTLEAAIKREQQLGGLILHSDQGLQYASQKYFELTKKYEITPSMSRPGHCGDNASIENFFGHFKEESLRQYIRPSYSEVKEIVDEYIHFYNYERLQLKTKQTPYEARCLFNS